MKLFVGLGNPGADYARHRHNVGFMAVERIAEHHGLGPWKKRFHGVSSEGMIAGRKVALLKPQTYMNDSGRSVGEAMRYLKIAPEDVVVFHDELDLAPAKIKVKTGGGNAGHNGLRSLSAHIGNEYARVRIGVATNDSVAGLKASLQRTGTLGMLDFTCGYDSGHGTKPAPGMVLAFCAAVRLKPDEIAVVGDAVHDLAMGRGANAALTVGVLSGTGTAAQLEPLADIVLNSINDLPALPTFRKSWWRPPLFR